MKELILKAIEDFDKLLSLLENKEESKIGESFRARCRELPSLMEDAGFVPALSFCYAKATKNVYEKIGKLVESKTNTIKDDDSDSHVISNGGPLIVPAGGYLVLCRNSDSGANGGVTCDYQYSGFTLANGADEVVLVDDGATPEEIDRVDYDGGGSSGDFPDPNGASMAYGGPPDATTDPSIDNNDGTRWGTSTSTYGDGDAGTPGTKNDDVLGPTAVTLSTLSASGFNPTMLALSLVAILALGAGAFVLRRRAVL